MGSKSRIPPPHLRRPLPGPGLLHHPDSFGLGIHPPPGGFPPFDMLPPPEVLEQKLAAQHLEMQRLATENEKLASTHGNLRQHLAGAQHELQVLHSQIGAIQSEREQQMRGLVDKIAKMEADLQAAETVKLELQQAQAEARGLIVARQELIAKAQELQQDLQRAHMDVQQVPALVAELENLRQEYQHCRATYDYEKKLYNDHLESLQVMEKNYITMAKEVEKLQGELTNTAGNERSGGAYGGPTGYNENEASGHRAVAQNAYEDSYGVPQGRATHPSSAGAGAVSASAAAAVAAAAAVSAGGGGSGATTATASGTPTYAGNQSGQPSARGGYDPLRGPTYDQQRAPMYDPQRGPMYDPQRGSGYDTQRGGPMYDGQRGSGYDAQRGPNMYDGQRETGYDGQRGTGYEAQRGAGYGAGYDPMGRGGGGLHTQGAGNNVAAYGSATPPNARAPGGYEGPPRGGGNPIRR